jgi:hypothetical protein
MATRVVLEDEAEQLRKQANLILSKSRLLELLAEYGKVKLTGSYMLNLMTTADIDVHVINPTIGKTAVKEVMDRLIRQDFFDGYHFHDWVSHFRTARFAFPNDDNPLKGYYMALRVVFRRRRWKIDVWFLKTPDSKGVRLMRMVKDNSTEKTRLTILKLKHMRDKRKLDVSSAVIYKAVTTKHVTSLPGLLRFSREAIKKGRRTGMRMRTRKAFRSNPWDHRITDRPSPFGNGPIPVGTDK